MSALLAHLFRDALITRDVASAAAEGAAVRSLAATLAAAPIPAPRTCQWPHGEPGRAEFRFCGDPGVIAGRPYCGRHCEVAYRRGTD